jgi:hypothetical protein
VINWMLEVEDVEDVACTVDDMEATRGWSEGRGYKSSRVCTL